MDVRMYEPYKAPPISESVSFVHDPSLKQLTSKTARNDHVRLHEQEERPERDSGDTEHDDG